MPVRGMGAFRSGNASHVSMTAVMATKSGRGRGSGSPPSPWVWPHCACSRSRRICFGRGLAVRAHVLQRRGRAEVPTKTRLLATMRCVDGGRRLIPGGACRGDKTVNTAGQLPRGCRKRDMSIHFITTGPGFRSVDAVREVLVDERARGRSRRQDAPDQGMRPGARRGQAGRHIRAYDDVGIGQDRPVQTGNHEATKLQEGNRNRGQNAGKSARDGGPRHGARSPPPCRNHGRTAARAGLPGLAASGGTGKLQCGQMRPRTTSRPARPRCL